MKISTKGRYALRMMVDLAQSGQEGPVALRDVAKRQGISEKYLEQLVAPLIRAGLLRSVRGASGGYLLTKAPEAYTVGEILRTQEGSLAPVDCAAADGAPCARRDSCPTAPLWRRIAQAVDQVVDATTLQDLADGTGQLSDNG